MVFAVFFGELASEGGAFSLQPQRDRIKLMTEWPHFFLHRFHILFKTADIKIRVPRFWDIYFPAIFFQCGNMFQAGLFSFENFFSVQESMQYLYFQQL